MTEHGQPERSPLYVATSVDVRFDADAHSVDAIQRAAYKFLDRFSMELTREDLSYRCRLCAMAGGAPDPSVVREFCGEVLDQVLRERIRNETEAVRNLILAVAFANAPIEGEPGA